MNLLEQLQLFWGKARPLPGAAHAWHPIVCHGLDVAAVGLVLLRRRPRVSARLRTLLGWDAELLRAGVPALLALHDLGKMTRPFQVKVPELWPAVALGPVPTHPPRDPGHGATGLRLLLALDERHELGLLDGWRRSEAELFLGPFLGHHGRPVAPDDRLTDLELFGAGRPVLDIAAAYLALVRGLFGIGTALPEVEAVEPATWPLAGLAALADWIGSRQEWFPYAAATIEPEGYWRGHALPRAEAAVGEAGIEPAPVRAFRGFKALCRTSSRLAG